MIDIEEAYDNLAYHTKESASLPLTFSSMTIDQQLFFRDLYDSIVYDIEEKEKLIEDLEMIKSDLECTIASVKKQN